LVDAPVAVGGGIDVLVAVGIEVGVSIGAKRGIPVGLIRLAEMLLHAPNPKIRKNTNPRRQAFTKGAFLSKSWALF
jgi:hypothetical protein